MIHREQVLYSEHHTTAFFILGMTAMQAASPNPRDRVPNDPAACDRFRRHLCGLTQSMRENVARADQRRRKRAT
jgi:hypothetical protein